VSFHEFPANLNTRQLWLNNIANHFKNADAEEWNPKERLEIQPQFQVVPIVLPLHIIVN